MITKLYMRLCKTDRIKYVLYNPNKHIYKKKHLKGNFSKYFLLPLYKNMFFMFYLYFLLEQMVFSNCHKKLSISLI